MIDHSVQVDEFASRLAIVRNAELEFERNRERYAFLRWGQGAFDELQGRAAEHRHLPPGEPRVPRPRRRGARRAGVPRHARRHRLAHDDDQRARRARLGRRRDRGRGGDARRGDLDARPAGRRLPAPRAAARGRDRDRPRADRHADPARDRRRREVRRVLRPRPRGAAARRPRDDREHVARVRRDVRLLPRRRGDAPLPAPHRPQRRADRARRGVLQGEHALARPDRARRRTRRSSSSTSRPSSRRSPGRAARRTGCRSRAAKAGVPRGARGASASTTGTPWTRRSPSRSPRATPRHSEPGAEAPEGAQSVEAAPVAVAPTRTEGSRASSTARSSISTHGAVVIAAITIVHEHVEPGGDGRGGPAREEGRRARPRPQAVGEVEPRARLEGRHRLLRARRADAVPRGARLPHGRLRLHDLHRELGPAARAGLAGDRRGRPRRLRRALRQPELRGARPSRGEGELPRVARRSSSPTRSPAAWTSTSSPSRSARTRTASTSSSRTSGRPPTRCARRSRARSGARCSSARTPTSSPATPSGASCRCPRASLFAWDDASTYVRLPPYFEGMAARAGHGRRHRRRALPRLARRLGHDRPHLAGRLDQAGVTRRAATSSSTASSARTSTPTARGAATTR